MKKNKMSYLKINKLIITMGLPMILSMILQALYNVIDTIFVINSSAGTNGNLALTAAFPIQILIIAIGVGTGVGINSLLSKYLGEGDSDKANKVAGNGIFLAFIIYLIFLIFGLFFSDNYMRLMSKDSHVIELGTSYLRICTTLSLGSIGYTVYERFLQSTGKTMYSMIAQVTGALANIILDYIFIYPLNMSVEGAALATIIGQFLSLVVAIYFHYFKNKEISGNIKYIKPSSKIIKTIYKIGLPAAIMQGLLALMMFVVLLIINTTKNESDMLLLTNTFGIYYKIMQVALFGSFGLSNTLITVISFNYGMKDKERVRATIKYGLIYSILFCLIITILFETLAYPISYLFGMSLPEVSDGNILRSDVINSSVKALRIASIGYIFMGFSVGAQGIMQGFRNIYKPVIISMLRLIIFVVPFSFIFLNTNNPLTLFWFTFPISEILTSIICIFLLKDSINKLDYSNEKTYQITQNLNN